MGKQITIETFVLATHNVGEADRFCILFTREKGKVTARARGVRKLKSTMGGSLLPHQHLTVVLRESSAGWMVSDTQKLSEWNDRDIDVFMPMQQGTELLISLLCEDEPLPELFTAVQEFFQACTNKKPHAVLAFTIQLLHILGVLPDVTHAYFVPCTQAQKTFLTHSVKGVWGDLPPVSEREKQHFSTLLAPLLSQVSSRPLKSGAVICDMKAEVAFAHAGAVAGFQEGPAH